MRIVIKSVQKLFFFVAIILLFWQPSFAQNEEAKKGDSYLTINGIVDRGENKPLGDATVKLFEKGNLENTINTGIDGIFHFKLDINSEYILEVSKPGLITKIFSINTTIPSYEKGIWDRAFSVTLFEPCQGVDMSLLSNPMLKLVYNERNHEFMADKNYEKVMIDKLHQLYDDNDKCIEEAYQSIVRKADRQFAEKKYTDARETYTLALNKRPDDEYVKGKIAEIDRILSAQKNNEKLYNDYVSQGDIQFKSKNYAIAKELYKRALNIKPGAEYPTSQIQAIDKLLADKNQQEQDKLTQESKYQQLMNQGNTAMNNGSYDKAAQAFHDALVVKPNDPVATQKAAEAERLLKDQQDKASKDKATRDSYNQAIATADKLFSASDYSNARSNYDKASLIIPAEDYPKQKIKEIDNILKNKEKDKANASEQQYKNLIALADKNFAIKNYSQAKQNYQDALNIKPAEAYPVQKISEIDKILAEQARIAAEQKAKKDAYDAAINKADNQFKNKQYDEALVSYKEASAYLPEEKYPYTKIDEISSILKQQESDKKYKEAISVADDNYKKKQLDLAKTYYQKALGFKPDDQYANDQIRKIDKDMADQLRLLADQKAKQDAYDKAIAQADKNFFAKDFVTARTNYQTALAIFNDKPYPKQKIDEIDKILKQQKKDDDYRTLIDDANTLFSGKNYEQAKAKYKEASLIKPEEQYPVEKIKEIDKILAQLELDKQNKLQNEKGYNDVLKNANDLFDKAQYDAAKKEYEKALSLMPNESYPKQRIAKINEIKSLLAKDAKTTTTKASTGEAKITDLKFKNDNEREVYLKELRAKYPEGVTCEVYKEKNRTVTRYIVIRENRANDYREVHYNWGGVDYIKNDKPITLLYFNTQVKAREGEYFTKTDL